VESAHRQALDLPEGKEGHASGDREEEERSAQGQGAGDGGQGWPPT
jgi:hypothetical protein